MKSKLEQEDSPTNDDLLVAAIDYLNKVCVSVLHASADKLKCFASTHLFCAIRYKMNHQKTGLQSEHI